ncbi:cell cycle checkpoint control protein RAD9A-like [Coregonus clupeaformis]|uniref:cell cycle checkpoint control protein RAD9A-like n=1 Tax=Coregonus clupeaformis TaxID=59861 RepID=UPI001E1C7C01|nr:cell cycle checkpoint control protein RAD9A-like [Coregonus clupeaformis]
MRQETVYFDEPGSPVVLRVTDSVLEVNFVLATLSDDSNLRNHNNNNTKRARSPPAPDDFMNDDIDSYLIAMKTSELAGPSDAPAARTPSPNHKPATCSLSQCGEEEEETEDTERPPNKKMSFVVKGLTFRSLFLGSVCPTDSQLTNQTIKSQEVLASDSEDDTQAGVVEMEQCVFVRLCVNPFRTTYGIPVRTRTNLNLKAVLNTQDAELPLCRPF